jgi:hypothetical protein
MTVRTHVLKCWPGFFNELWHHRKTFEIRKNDRDYQVKDKLEFQEYDQVNDTYSGRRMHFTITHLIPITVVVNGIGENYVILSRYCQLQTRKFKNGHQYQRFRTNKV